MFVFHSPLALSLSVLIFKDVSDSDIERNSEDFHLHLQHFKTVLSLLDLEGSNTQNKKALPLFFSFSSACINSKLYNVKI